MRQAISNPASSILDGPVVERIKRLELFSRLRVEGSRPGENRSPRLGFSTDFSQHRQHFPGDGLRHVDWRVLARTDRMVVKQYEDLTNAEMAVLVDVSGSMGFAGAGMSKLEFAVRCAGILTYLMHVQADSYSLQLFGEGVGQFVPRGSGRRQLRRVLEMLVAAAPAGQTRFVECFRQVESRLRRKGLVIVLSDFMAEPGPVAAGLGRLRMRGHDVVAFQVFDPAERELDFVDLTRFRDLEDGSILAADPVLIRQEYRRQFDLHQLAIKEQCLAHGFDHVVLPVADEYDEVIGDYLRRRAALGS